MIHVVQGKVGEGKSYFVVDRIIIPHLLAGGIVATNMHVFLEKVSKNFHRKLRVEQLIHIDAADSPFEIPRGDFRGRGRRKVLVVLDEALNWFASSSGAKDERKATWGEWLRQSDKLGQDVYFIAQAFERSAKWIRELAQVLYSITNLKNVSFLKMPIGKWLHLHRIYAVAKYDIRSASLCGWWLRLLEPRTWDCYDTSELYGFPASSNAYSGLDIAPPFRLPLWPFVVLLLSLLLGVFFV